MTTRGRLGAGLAWLILTLVGCGGDDTTPSTTLLTTTSPAPSSSTLSTTSTTTSTATPTTTAAVTSTTVDELAATKAAVAAAAVQSRQDYLYAVQNYDAPDALAVLGHSAAANSPAFQQGVDNIENLRSNGWRVKPNPEVPSALTVEGEVTLLDGPLATTAELTVCEIGAGIVYEPGTGPGGADTIVNDEINARRSRMKMVLENGAWKVHSGQEIGSWNGQASCPAV